jgi:predicted glycoside hydrolase/deacetylase ChbG (UPF0249 family)
MSIRGIAMNRYYKVQASQSEHHQRQIRAELSRQVEDFLKKGGHIEQLDGPNFKPHRSVRVSSSAFTEML